MIADLVDKTYHIRLITRNVMSVYSTDKKYTDNFIVKLKNSDYIVSKKSTSSDSIISRPNKNYNKYENIFRYVKHNKSVDYNRFVEYLSYLNLNHILWMHFYQLDQSTTSLVELLIQLSGNKPIIVTDYLECIEHNPKLDSLLFHIGLDNRLIIVPYTDVAKAVNCSTCQCYVKSDQAAKVQATFSNEFINTEFNTSTQYYNNSRPALYKKETNQLSPTSYKYSLYELILILLYSIKMLYISFFNWRSKVNVS